MSPLSPLATATPVSFEAVQVVCAWPVSGQYGPGSRVLYYILVAGAILGRKKLWLRHACLAVALVFPAVAAIHGIVLASTHVNGAVDMDVYGAFQLCSIGILAAPTTVRLSRTYQDAPGRNTIFLWTGLVVAGLLSLIVEFYRATPVPCNDTFGRPITLGAGDFPFGRTTCSLTCSEDEGPFSPTRGGAASNIYVIPAPDKLKFNTALIIAAACCIPAILSITFTWIQILERNWRRRYENEPKGADELIPGTNGATITQMKGVNEQIRKYQNYIEVPLFGAVVLAILIIGELNFFSKQVRFQTEPIASIGQWAPIAGTVLAAFGSLYLILAREMEALQETGATEDLGDTTAHRVSHEFGPVMSRATNETGIARAATAINRISDKLGTAAHAKFDDSSFKHGQARDFPSTPGEHLKNPKLPYIQEQYNPPRDSRGDVTPEFRPIRSRTGSFTNISVSSGLGISGIEGSPGPSSPGITERRGTVSLEVPSPSFHRP